MTDFTALNAEAQKLIDEAVAAVPVFELPTVSVSDLVASETAGKAIFTISLNKAFDRPVTVGCSTANGTAIAGQDYTGKATSVTIPAGALSATFSVTLLNDTAVEGDETFSLSLNSARIDLVIADAVGVATIISDDVTPPPPSTGFPDASNTGVPAGTALTNSGSITTTAANQIIELKNISGMLNINHNGVIVRKCKIASASFSVVRVADGLSVPPVIEDCEVDAKQAEGSNAINGYGTFRRLNIHNCENCFNVTGDGCLIEDCYLWGLKAVGSDPHYDNIQIDGGTANHVIRHNTIINDYGQTAAVMIDNWFGPISNILVDNNVLKGGGYTCYSDGQFSGGPITGVKFTNNRFKKGFWGYATWNNNIPVWTGNTDFDTGNPIPISEA